MDGNESKRLRPNDDVSKQNSKKIKFNSEENESNCSNSNFNAEQSSSLLINRENEIDIDDGNLAKISIEKQKSMGIDEILVCSICQEIIYNCVSIQPCLHSFCAICLLQWRRAGVGCPTCRGKIKGVSKNHLVENIVNKFLIQKPEKDRSFDEKHEADSEVQKYSKILYSVEYSSNSTSSSISVPDQSLNNCIFCNYPGVITQTGTTINGISYICNSTTVHVRCKCCQIHIPHISNDNTLPPHSCQVCNEYFCSLLLGDCTGCPDGCLFTLRHFIFHSNLVNLNQVPQFLPDNFYETNVLRNYLNSYNISVYDMYIQCLNKLSQGTISLEDSISLGPLTPLCEFCARKATLDMVYEYFVSIPKSSLPQDVTSRQDCYYGRNCRTQRHRQTHCVDYNHACPQTRF